MIGQSIGSFGGGGIILQIYRIMKLGFTADENSSDQITKGLQNQLYCSDGITYDPKDGLVSVKEGLDEKRSNKNESKEESDNLMMECGAGAIHAFELSAGLGFPDYMGRRRTPSTSVDLHSPTPANSKLEDLKKDSWRGLVKDTRQIFLLLVLYTVQGIPMGLSGSIPFLLQGRVSYKELGVFSLVSLPFR